MSAEPDLILGASGPFRLPAVVVSHGWFQTAPFAWDGAGERLDRVEALDGGGVALAVSQAGAAVAVRASAPLSGPAREAARARITRVLQLEADLDGFSAAAEAVDPVLARDLAGYGAARVLAGGTLFEDVVKGLCATNTTWRQAVSSINRLGELGTGGAFPAPADLLRAGEDDFRARARVGYRAPALVDAARAAIDGRLAEIEADAAAGDEERAYAGLLALQGIGPATAGFILLLMGHFGRPSVDSATIRVATEAWFGGRRPTPAEVRRRIAPAGRFGGLVLAWATLRSWQRATGLVSPD